MAQAARLSLRLQKELKLLLSDPPPGVTLPSITQSECTSSTSLKCIEARMEGPDGTVYSKGVFMIKIQIPESYPFQPPNVTFVTPIYHPNIDNGGRICLDILNLPPKGAWQPSLNISTILTSISLLLSEPNPDDGLMAEASREYKYNRQAFNQKAGIWIEKYAYPGFKGDNGDISDKSSLGDSNMNIRKADACLKITPSDSKGGMKKLRLGGEKVSVVKEETQSASTDDDSKRTRKLTLSSTEKHIAGFDGILRSSQAHIVGSAGNAISQHAITCEDKLAMEETNKMSDGDDIQETSSKAMETIIVSDSSEDEGEESASFTRFKLSLMRSKKLGNLRNKCS